MDAEQYSRETFVNPVTEQSIYGVLDFERRGKGRGRGVHMYCSLSEIRKQFWRRFVKTLGSLI
jgi:cell division control protein 6